jgi:pilus assembly protein CpaB
MQKTNRILFILSLVFAVLVGLAVYRFFGNLEAMANSEYMDEVVIAQKAIPARTTITADMVAVTLIPKGSRHSGAFTTTAQVVGQITTQPIIAGEQVLGGRLFASTQQTGLSYRIPDGYRAVSVGITQRIAVSYLLRPGDFVDVIASYDMPLPDTQMGREQSTSLILQGIEVLAIGPELKSGASAPNTAETITLAVKPDQAEKLIWAEDYGKIRLVLRPVTDHKTVTTQGATAKNLAGQR